MFFFLEKHIIRNKSVYPTDFKYIRAKNIDKIKEYLTKRVSANAKSIKSYYDNPYHVFDYIDLMNDNVIYRFGKVNLNEIEENTFIEEIK